MTCLTEGCEGKSIARGVCKTCYYRLLRRIHRSKTTWGDLIKDGKCKRARSYYGLTTAMRRENALSSVRLKKDIQKTCST